MNPKAQLDTKRQKTFKDHFKDNKTTFISHSTPLQYENLALFWFLKNNNKIQQQSLNTCQLMFSTRE